jgi:ABC-type polysaccharide/polyol phosphate transport system ATPase subunit/cyclophilin family peptidyl-prolyl cis-trans isomerase
MALNGSSVHQPNSIAVRNVSLRIPMRRKATNSLKADPLSLLASFYLPSKTRREVRTILDDLTFEVGDGNRLALIGRNGAGKTTLLRVLAGSVLPTRGSVERRGTVQALLNVSLGFRPEATGLENIYLQGLSMGMHLAQIRDTAPEIVEFSELGDAIYDPTRTYSTGMRARLAFAIATSHAPNILLMDEWIGAGDKYFVKKAQERLRAQIETCRALVLASHNNNIIKEICSHGLVLEAGRGMFFGKIDDALKFYDEWTSIKKSAAGASFDSGGIPAAAVPEHTLIIETSEGRIVVEMRSDLSPRRVARIQDKVRQGFYDGVPLRRAIGGFGGKAPGAKKGDSDRQPTAEPQTSGKTSKTQEQSETSADSQFFICFDDGTFLDCKYTVWGRVIEGKETIDKINRGKSSDDSDKILSARMANDVKV